MYLGHVSGIVDITSAYEQNTDTCHLLLIFVLLWFHMSAGGGGGGGGRGGWHCNARICSVWLIPLLAQPEYVQLNIFSTVFVFSLLCNYIEIVFNDMPYVFLDYFMSKL